MGADMGRNVDFPVLLWVLSGGADSSAERGKDVRLRGGGGGGRGRRQGRAAPGQGKNGLHGGGGERAPSGRRAGAGLPRGPQQPTDPALDAHRRLVPGAAPSLGARRTQNGGHRLRGHDGAASQRMSK